MKRLLVIVLFTIVSLSSHAQSLCEKLAAMKAQYYGFLPTSLKSKQQEAKSADLDKFWNLAKTDPDKALPCLKEMILNENNDLYFCFDASTLILSLDKKQQYLDVVLAGVNKTDLKQLQLEIYLQACFFLAKNGKDVTAATEKLISTPGAHVYLTIHVIDLSAIDASLFLYNTMTTEIAERSLINTITNGNPTGRHNAAVVLNILSTPRGDSLLNKLIDENKLADSTKAFVLKDRKDFISQGKAELSTTDEESIRKERQESMPGLSDEGLGRYFKLTGTLMALRNKKYGLLYKQ